MTGAPRLLLATTTWWPSLAVLASAFEEAGFDVVMLCPKGHVAWQARHFACRELDRRRPAAGLLAALEALAPALLVPGDERIVHFLRHLHVAHPRWHATIERAIGRPSSHHLLTARVPLLQAAPAAGFATPRTRAIASDAELGAWVARTPPPWVLKLDGAWGGEGVRVTADVADAQRTFRAFQGGIPLALALRRRFVNGDLALWQEWRARHRPAISAQAFVPGHPGNCAVFALDGRVLGATVVEAEATCGDNGPSVLVRAVDRPEVVASAGRLVRQLGLSGFIGFDFIVDRTGAAVLIEMNPRVTLPCRIQGPFGPASITAAADAFRAVRRSAATAPRRGSVAAFPLAWLADPFVPALKACVEDLPWREPGLLREALRPLWPERGILASTPSRLRTMRGWVRGQPRPDYRYRSFAWWLACGGLGGTDVPVRATARPVTSDGSVADPEAGHA